MSPQTPSSPNPIQHRIKRKPPPTLDISERYPSPDPSDPFAPLWVLRNRTSSGLSSQEVLDSRTRSSYLYPTTTAQVSLNTSISPIRSPSQTAKIGHYHTYSQSTFIDSPQVFPLASQPDLLYRQQPSVDRRINVRPPRQTSDMSDSSGTESDTPFPSHKAEFIQPRRTASANYQFSKVLLLRKASFLGSGKTATRNQSSMIEFKQLQKSNISPPFVPTVTWGPDPVSRDSIHGTLTSGKDIHHRHRKALRGSKYLKLDFPRLRKLPSIPLSPKLSRRIPSSSSNNRIAPKTRSESISYVRISKPTPALSCSQPTSEDAYTSPPEAPVHPPISVAVQKQVSKECPDKSCGDNSTSSESEWDIPSPFRLIYAASLPITGDDGKHIAFGSLFESQCTIVIFIRHLWCPLCQDYMSSVKSVVHPEMVGHYGPRNQSQNHGTTEVGGDRVAGTRVRFVVICNGAHGMIAKYRQIFGLPFKVYTDPTLALYQALGMGRDSDLKHHNHQTHRRSSSESSSSDVISEKKFDSSKNGGYVKHSLMGGIAMVMMRTLKVRIPVREKGGNIGDIGQLEGEVPLPLGRVCKPVWEKGGDTGQLGGEFVFGPG